MICLTGARLRKLQSNFEARCASFVHRSVDLTDCDWLIWAVCVPVVLGSNMYAKSMSLRIKWSQLNFGSAMPRHSDLGVNFIHLSESCTCQVRNVKKMNCGPM